MTCKRAILTSGVDRAGRTKYVCRKPGCRPAGVPTPDPLPMSQNQTLSNPLARCAAMLGMLVAVLAVTPGCGKVSDGVRGLLDHEDPQEPATPELSAESFHEVTPEPEEIEELPHDKSAQVSILCYHEFISSGNPSDMRIRIEDFRRQMELLRDSGVEVISMETFLAWRRGEQNIANPSVMITIDDGWLSTYTHAFPVLKEFDFPFTIFLYTNYISGGGRALNPEQIREMLAYGAELGSHSRSHPMPSRTRSILAAGGEAAEAHLKDEMIGSAERLEALFGVRPRVYAYPGGYYDEVMFPYAEEAGYEALFTVNPAKVTYETPLEELHRYVIHGDKPFTFDNATTFRGVPLGRNVVVLGGSAEQEAEEVQEIFLRPADGETVKNRYPLIEVDLSVVEGIDPESILMRISGLGQVFPNYDERSGRLTYQVTRRLRMEEYTVFVYWRREGGTRLEAPLVWRFRVDLKGSLLREFEAPESVAPAIPVGRDLEEEE